MLDASVGHCRGWCRSRRGSSGPAAGYEPRAEDRGSCERCESSKFHLISSHELLPVVHACSEDPAASCIVSGFRRRWLAGLAFTAQFGPAAFAVGNPARSPAVTWAAHWSDRRHFRQERHRVLPLLATQSR